MQTIALTIYFLFLAIYFFLIFSIRSQVKKYLLPHDNASSVLKIFVFGAFVLTVVSAILFFITPWKNINIDALIKSSFMPSNFDNFINEIKNQND